MTAIDTVTAMRLQAAQVPLRRERLPLRPLREHEVLLKVSACGVCRTDLHLFDGELAAARYPVTPGHEIVGRVVALGAGVATSMRDTRLGVPWLASTCGSCSDCRAGRENLCANAQFTGCSVDGGYADFAIADSRFCLPLPQAYSDAEAAPLLCAGLIGYRAYRLAGDADTIGLYGFGAAAHLLCQLAVAQGRRVFAFTRPGDVAAQGLARRLGAAWAGNSDAAPPCELDAALLFAPVGELVPEALRRVRRGGRVICAGIHMSRIPEFPYELLWGERSVQSVANLTRADGVDFMRIAAEVRFRPQIELFPLVRAQEALTRLAKGSVQGAAVLVNDLR